MRKTYWPVITAVSILLLLAHSAGADVRSISGGVYVDAAGARHNWLINDTGALMWEGKPYLPVGAAVTAAYLSSQTDEAWQADVRTLEALKSRGITDIIIRDAGPATTSPAAAWQRLVDYLEAQGFTYGVDISDGPARKASGFIVCPARYKLPDLTQTGEMQLALPKTYGGFFVTAEQTTGSVLDSGVIRVSGDRVTVTVRPSETKSQALLLFPVKDISTGGGSLPDLWQGYDEYRDRLIDFFGRVKFGPGLRFFLDPLGGSVAPMGESESAIPDSARFRMEFEAWLSLKYDKAETVFAAWGIGRRDVGSYEQAARLIPLWWKGRGLGLAYDRASDRYIEVDVPKSRMWQDILEFRDLSLQEYMNGAADTLKRFAAAVPVLFTADSYNRIFVTGTDGGFDGLVSLPSEVSAGQAYALAADSGKTVWLVGTASSQTSELSASLTLSKELGAKGFFAVPSGAEAADQLASFKDELSADAADYVPEVLFYPSEDAPGASMRKVDHSIWWLPTMRRGEHMTYGDNIFAYEMPGDLRSHADTVSPLGATGEPATASSGGVVLWSNAGPVTITILPQGRSVGISSIDKDAVMPGKKGTTTLRLSNSPIVVYGISMAQLFPLEVAKGEIDLLAQSIAAISKAGGSATGYATIVQTASSLLEEGLAAAAYDQAASNLKMLASTAGSSIWLEGEWPQESNFTDVESLAGCSGGRYLALASDDAAPAPYSAFYSFYVPSEGNYEIWFAATSPAEPGNSDLRYHTGVGDWQQVLPAQQSAAYANGISWFRAGSSTLTRGDHSIVVQALKPKNGGPYKAAIDAILLTKKPFVPAGAKKPAPM